MSEAEGIDTENQVEGVQLVPSPETKLGGLVEPGTLKELYKRSNWEATLKVAVILATYCSLFALGRLIDVLGVWILIWLLQAVILSGFLGAAHDCAHNTMFTNSRANRFAGAIWSSIALFNFSLYKWFHLIHHKNTSVRGDTEPGGEFPSIWVYLRALPTDAFFVAFWKMSWLAQRGIFPDFVPSKKGRRDVRVDNIFQVSWVFVVLVLTAAFPISALEFYLIPILLYFPMVSFTSLPEHYGCERGTNVWKNTRSIKSNALFRYFFWNGNFHAAHHIAPGIPSRNLQKFHSLIEARLEHVNRSYMGFHAKLIWQLIFSPPKEVELSVDPNMRINFEYEMYKTGDKS